MLMNKRINIQRYRQIVAVFAKHGFGLLLDQLGILEYLKIRRRISRMEPKSEKSRLSTGMRLRMACEELGPTFVKIGQMLSTRPDIFPSDIIQELEKLQDSVNPIPFEEVRALIESEFDSKLEQVFKEFSHEPVAAASMSQVHYARLHSGLEVAVKVQRPGIEQNIGIDFNILKDVARFANNHTKYGRMYDFSSMAADFEMLIRSELDFTREGENADIFRKNFRKDDKIFVPEIQWAQTTRRVLTMEYVSGMRISDHAALEKAGLNRENLAQRLGSSIINQILRDGFFHADPHPGNIRVLPDGRIVFLDLGMVGILNEARRAAISKFFIGVTNKNSRMVIRSIIELDNVPRRSNLKKFEKDVDSIIDKYLTLPVSEMKISDMLNEVFNIAFMHHVGIPREFALLAKTLATLQNLIERLTPDLNAYVIAQPIAKKLIYQTFSPKRIGLSVKKGLLNYGELIHELPSVMLDFFGKMENDDFTFQVEIKDIDKMQKRLDRDINRISFCIVLLAVSIIIAGIIIGSGLSANTGTEMYLLNVTILKIGLAIAGVIILGLIISIFRSASY